MARVGAYGGDLVVGLTDVEAQLVEAVEKGTVLDLAGTSVRCVRGSVIRDVLRGVIASAPDPRGLRLREALVEGDLDLTDVRTTVPVELVSCVFSGTVLLDRAHLSSLDLTGSEFASLSGWYLACEHDVDLTGVRCTGGLELAHADIGGQLSLTDAELTNDAHPALNADGIHTAGTVFLDEEFYATSASAEGTVRLLAAHIGGRLTFTQAAVTNTAGPAIYADNAHIDGDTWIDNCQARGHSEHATISLIDATIGRDIKFSGTTVINSLGSAFNADGIKVGGSVFLDDDLRADGHGSRGFVRLPGARIAGQLSLDGAQFTTHSNSLSLDLTGVHVADELILDADALIADESFRLDCDGLQYLAVPRRARRHTALPGALRIPVNTLLDLLRERTPHYAAQPYQQLAATYRAEGHARDARAVLIAQQHDLRKRGQLGGPLTKTWHRISGVTIGYGYRPGRALLGLLLTILIANVLVLTAAATSHTSRSRGQPPGACTPLEHVGLAADLAVPLIKTGGRQRCDFTSNPGSEWFIATGWLTQFLGWAFATLFVAGFTGLVRKQ